jgi:hypothetical protein
MAYAQPVITSISPATAKPGDAVTLTGTGFNTTAANNIVFFGATRALVTAATATSVTATVPSGATYAPVVLLNTGSSLAAASLISFNPVYDPPKGGISLTDMSIKVDFTSGTEPTSVAIGDLDGDGKPDLAVTNHKSYTVSVYRNTSAIGSITGGSFASKVDFTTAAYPESVAVGDLDGDGRLDLAVACMGSVSVLRNTSVGGSISFAATQYFSAGTAFNSIAVGDLDGDGRPDLAVVENAYDIVCVLRNTSASGSIGFAEKVDFATGSNPLSVAIGDLDGDGKPDLAVANGWSNTVSVIINTSVSGSINSSSFAGKVDLTTGSGPGSVAIGDLDGDDRPDLAVTNSNSHTVSVLENNVGSSETKC